MQTRTFGRLGWPVTEIGYGMWGMGGWSGIGRRGVARRARPVRRARLQLLRHRLGLRRRPQRAVARPDAAPAPGPAPVRRHEGAAEEPAVARDAPRTRWPTCSRPITSASTPRRASEPGRGDDRPAAVARLDRRVGRRRRAGAGGRGSEAGGTDPGFGISINRWEPANVLRRARDRRSSTPCRWSTTSSTRRPRTSCSPRARAWTWRSSRACRSTRAA